MRSERWLTLLQVLVGLSLSAGETPALAQKVKTLDAGPIDSMGPQVTRLFKTPAFAPLREPDRVEVLPVEIAGVGLSSTFHVVEKPVVLDAQTMRGLRKTLLNPESYGGFTACMFDPAVAIRFHKGKESIQALICFTCGEVIFQDASGRDLSSRMWFEQARTHLLPAARKAFPDAHALRMLPE